PNKCKAYLGLTYFCKHRLGLAVNSVNFFQDDTDLRILLILKSLNHDQKHA
ncbi:MAG: hypothetical protein K0Q79_3209, partial [Flavipsychrobacter sp.]|nr:hypothetical protein [Flavipsychrobacter sp.]